MVVPFTAYYTPPRPICQYVRTSEHAFDFVPAWLTLARTNTAHAPRTRYASRSTVGEGRMAKLVSFTFDRPESLF